MVVTRQERIYARPYPGIVTAPTVTVLAADVWRTRRVAHERRVDGWITPHLLRRRGGGKHPVEDFLFTYYSHRPAQLRRWHPGAGMVLHGADPAQLGAEYRSTAAGAVLDLAAVLARRGESVRWIRDLLAATAGRPPFLGCFGMHEWAMVYRQTAEEVRHHQLPLRLGAAGTAALVEATRIRCSHFDAFRFFTAPARALNVLQPSRETQPEHEQPGCLHANMDLYRWAYKLAGLAPGELVADCFELAREIRVVDMRAGPYDLTSLGLAPLPVETPEGRARYVRHQQDFYLRAATLRERLLAVCDSALAVGGRRADHQQPTR